MNLHIYLGGVVETKKVAIACLIGGVICSAVALAVAPALWWLGLLAGFAGGYFGYEAREVLRAVPLALRIVVGWGVWGEAWKKVMSLWSMAVVKINEVKEYLLQPHHFLYPTMLIVISTLAWYLWPYRQDLWPQSPNQVAIYVIGWFLLLSIFLLWALAIVATIYVLAFSGARIVDRSFWVPFLLGETDTEEETERLERLGYRKKSLTYGNLLLWVIQGMISIVAHIPIKLTVFVFLALWYGVPLFARFAWLVIKLIHSQKRLLCGIDSAIGGAISYFVFAPSAVGLAGQVVVVLFGGLLGAGLGVVNFEIVSKRVLKVVHVD